MTNLLTDLPDAAGGEAFAEILTRPGVRIERIVSGGQATPEDSPWCQAWDEWVLLLAGSAAIRLDGRGEVALSPGDHLLIPAGVRHWVTRTDASAPTVWLAIHFD